MTLPQKATSALAQTFYIIYQHADEALTVTAYEIADSLKTNGDTHEFHKHTALAYYYCADSFATMLHGFTSYVKAYEKEIQKIDASFSYECVERLLEIHQDLNKELSFEKNTLNFFLNKSIQEQQATGDPAIDYKTIVNTTLQVFFIANQSVLKMIESKQLQSIIPLKKLYYIAHVIVGQHAKFYVEFYDKIYDKDLFDCLFVESTLLKEAYEKSKELLRDQENLSRMALDHSTVAQS